MTSIQPYISTHPQTPEVKNVETSVMNCWQSIVLNPLLQNLTFVQNVTIANGAVVPVKHQLGKNLNGWIIVRKNTNGDIYESGTVSTNPTLYINMTANNTVTCSFLFF